MSRLTHRNALTYLGDTLVVAVAYYIAGHLTLLLATTPSHATPIWPAAGIALAAVLIKGYRVLPGIFISELIISGEIFGFELQSCFVVNGAMGLQALLHAWSGAFLIRRTIGKSNPLNEDATIIKFMILGGPASALIPALISLLSLWSTGIVGAAHFAMGFFTWWLGNSIGVIIFTPLTLILFGKPRTAWHSRTFSVALPLTFVFILILIFFGYAQQKEQERLRLIFEDRANTIHNALAQKLTAHFEILYALKSYFEGPKLVTRAEFLAFTEFTLERHASIQALEWIPRVTHESRDAFESAGDGFPITELTPDGDTAPAAPRSEYFPVLYTEPVAENRKALGFDVSSNPVVRQAQIRTLSTGELSATAPLKLVRQEENQPSFVIYQAVRLPGSPEREPFSGLIAGVFNINRLIREALADTLTTSGIKLGLIDKTDANAPITLLGPPFANTASAMDASRYHKKISTDMAGRKWVLEFLSTPDFISENSSWTFWWIFSAGFLFTGLSGIALLSMTGHRAHLEAEIDERTNALRNSERNYRELVESANSIILRWDSDGKILFFNRYAQDFFGYSEDEIIGRNVMDTIVPEIESETGRPLRVMIEDIGKNPERYVDNENENMRRDGSRVWVNWANHPIYGANGNIREILSIGIDITEKKNAAQNLRKLSLAVEHSPSAVIITDTMGTIEYVNPKFTEITGYPPEEAIGQTPRLLRSGEVPREKYRELWNTLLAGKEWRGLFHNRKKNGELYWAQEFIAPIKNDAAQITHFVAIQEDVTEARRVSERISFQASHDVLTGLINRREFEQCLKRVIGTAKQNHSEHSLCFLDLDRFKIVNDTCGHVAGDELLRQVGLLLRDDLRKRDVLARLGGDEFAILMEYCSVSQASRIATKIRNRIEQFRFFWGERTFTIGVSVGITAVNKDSPDITDLINQADNACYAAKDAGRGRVHLFQEDDQELAQRMGEIRWVSEITQAIEYDRFRLHAQPIVSLTGDPRISYEIFLRMEDNKGSIIPPNAFLAAAERYDLINKIDRWVIDSATHWIGLNSNRLPPKTGFSLNLSGLSLSDETLPAFILSCFENAGVNPENILFEISETSAINNLFSATSLIKALGDSGCRFALDDFGSGLSSFAYLKTLPVDFLKIDGHLVQGIEQDPVHLAMLRSINEIGHIMGMQTIAKSVESRPLVDALKALGVDFAQGYAIGPPVPLEQIVAAEKRDV
ncbi:MAG: EAL domain-containing protein [Pseudomonadota bacterium]